MDFLKFHDRLETRRLLGFKLGKRPKSKGGITTLHDPNEGKILVTKSSTGEWMIADPTSGRLSRVLETGDGRID